jgi:cyclopropane fatty-acyl-phospholipid synthase-like methyltransferase
MNKTMTLGKWHKYWESQTSPLHRSETREHYQQYGSELKILFENKVLDRVLEIGCGNGALYEHLGFNRADHYHGIDFSPGMLEVFKKNYPDVQLQCVDGAAYSDQDTYDLIFSNGVIQNFDIEMLDRHFSNIVKMMNQDSTFVCASIPWKSQKIKYFTGQLGGQDQSNILVGYLAYFKSLFEDEMGSWYNFDDIFKIAEKYNLSVVFYSSMHYMYRFHAVMKLK